MEISQERYSLLGMLKLKGGGVIHQYFMHSVAVPPKVDRPLGGTLPRERERNRKRQRDTGSREEKEKISRCTDRGWFPSLTLYVKMWVFPRRVQRTMGEHICNKT